MCENVFNKPDGRKWKPYTSTDVVHCVSCDNKVDTPEEIASYPSGSCPQCGYGWTGGENRSTIIKVTMPESITGGVG